MSKLTTLYFVVLASWVVSCSTVPNKSFLKQPLQVEEANKSDLAVLYDSIYAVCWYMNDIESYGVFGKSYSQHNIYPYILSFTNNTSGPVYFYSDSVPNYYPIDSLYKHTKTANESGTMVLGGLLFGLALPFIMTNETVDDSGNTTNEFILPMKPLTFAITAGLGLVSGITSAIEQTKPNREYYQCLHQVSKPELIIPSGFNGYTLVFTKHYPHSYTTALDSNSDSGWQGVPDSVTIRLLRPKLTPLNFNVPITK